MKIYRELRVELKKHGLTRQRSCRWRESIQVHLKIRFTGMPWRGSVIAKTGTLIRTDGGASSLVGQMRTANGEVLLFVIMNQRGSVWRFRENQDYLVMLVQNSRGGPKAFDYKPPLLTMQLSHTESTVANRRVRTTITIELSHIKTRRRGTQRVPRVPVSRHLRVAFCGGQSAFCGNKMRPGIRR